MTKRRAVYLTDDEYELVNRFAAYRCNTFSGYVKSCIFKDLRRNHIQIPDDPQHPALLVTGPLEGSYKAALEHNL